MGWTIRLNAQREIEAADYLSVRNAVVDKFPQIEIDSILGSIKHMELRGSYSTAGKQANLAADTAKTLLEIKGYTISSDGLGDSVAPSFLSNHKLLVVQR
jgi:hypothetical protein